MTDTNYTPDEVRLLDMAAMCAISTLTGIPIDDEKATRSYDLAAAMIAERRKRVPSGSYAGEPVYAELLRDTQPVAQPQPQPEQAGELTEEAVEMWWKDAWSTKEGDWFCLVPREINRAVALMREGLRYKMAGNSALSPEASQQLALDLDLAAKLATAERERDTYKRLLDEGAKAVGHAAEKERDQWKAKWEHAIDVSLAGLTKQLQDVTARAEKAEAELIAIRNALRITEEQPIGAWLIAREQNAQAWADKCKQAEAALAEAQPVLDAVAGLFRPGTSRWQDADTERHLTLRAYADRRREQAKGAS